MENFPRVQIHNVLALKPCGFTYMSFKWGDNETVDNWDRYFNNYTTTTLQALIDELPKFTVIDLWSETKLLRGSEHQWDYVLVKTTAKHV